jgi:hypothetical protein
VAAVSDWTTEYRQLIDDCEARESRLDEWSCRFLDSIKAQLADGRPLSAKQTEKLDEIWERATARG